MTFKDYRNERKADLENAAIKALTKVGFIVESSAKTKARFDTGQLRDSFDSKVVPDGAETLVYIGTNVEHFPHHEFGTGEFSENGMGRKGGWYYKTPDGKWHYTEGVTAQPMLRPAYRENLDNIKRVIASTLRQELG